MFQVSHKDLVSSLGCGFTCGKPNSNLMLVSKRVETRSGGGKGPSLNTQLEQEVFGEYLKCFSDVMILVMTRTPGSVKL